MANSLKKTNHLLLLFRLGMWWRIIYGLFKLIFGLVLLNFIHSNFTELFYRLMSHELVQDPNDIFIKTVGAIINKNPLDVSYFVVIYFIFWGSVDMFLSINLLKFRIWAYPLAVALISSFVMYEIYRFAHTHSIILFLVILIDLATLWLINKTYKNYGTLSLKNSA